MAAARQFGDGSSVGCEVVSLLENEQDLHPERRSYQNRLALIAACAR
jgi:hypothetical protein